MPVTTPPSITALPTPPDPNDRSTFNTRAYPWSVAQQTLATQVGAVATNVFDNATDAEASATLAVEKATEASASADAAALSEAAAEDARDMAQTYAGLAGDAAGFPPLAGNAGKVVRVNDTEDGVQFAPGSDFEPGDVYLSTSAPASGTWLPCLGGVYLQSSYTALFAELGLLANKPDGIATWTSRTLPASSAWTSVAFGNGVFVAVASTAATCTTSVDGITWVSRTMPSAAAWSSVFYGAGLFVAVGNNAVATSPDGITWTARTISTGNWSSVTYGGGQFVAVAAGLAKAATSLDGITWTDRTMSSSRSWRSVVYGNGVYVAVAGSVANTVASSSPDGISWTDRTLPLSVDWQSVSYGSGVFVAVNKTTPTTAATSTNGTTWVAQAVPAIGLDLRAITYGAGQFVAVASASTTALNSTDGVNWTTRTLSVSQPWASVAFGAGVFAVVGNGTANASVCAPLYTYDLSTQFAVPTQPVASGLKAWIKAL